MYYEQHRNLQQNFNEKSYEAQGLKNPLFDDKVLDYRAKYDDACAKIQALEN
eukprot:CAMPEP_0202980152 /NCGR_PEP_ID=MMETSP1396-20130829/86127_1 /ASSEMBLY_ACC=CAM_ASM_000872 /TAXON_ID= /ORGANISM="Pseudokeronopsis sp., Strain Brazil" /LENGTH=51 /DNA_ID=CAMNT_0049719941 /DNA_START=682 /DNA_END=837 /DNA_ORIENTATION=-